MKTDNWGRLPVSARNVLEPFIDELTAVYGGNILSIFVYGSVTGEDYNPRTSDINVALVLDDISIEKIKPGLKAIKKARRKRITAPLFLTPPYIKHSLDTFPMEFLCMRETGLVLAGQDILRDLGEIKNEDLRGECEYQIKGKLLTIRQAYLEQALDKKGMEGLIKMSFRALMPVFQSMVKLKSGSFPPDKEDTLRKLADEFSVDVSSFMEILKDRKTDGRIGNRPAEAFISDFLVQIEKLAVIVDVL
ncbi:MAG: hypothetical protein ABH883_02255 [Candidatus Omnitrophota bacterium]